MRNNVGAGASVPFTTWGRASLAGAVLTAATLIPLGSGSPAAAASSPCTPDSGFTGCAKFLSTGGDQTFTVPTGISSLSVRLWGAAGAGAVDAGNGGGGGYTTGTVPVTAGDVLTVTAGSGSANSTATYGGGGAGGGGVGIGDSGGSGGGMSALWSGGYGVGPLLIAGGGGGGGGQNVINGGGGGGTTGGADTDPSSGAGGTATAGGSKGTSWCGGNRTDGASLTGGHGSDYVSGGGGGGGGGGGLFGGGGGDCTANLLARISAASGSGGGGSGYKATGVTDFSTTQATSSVSAGAGANNYSSGIGSSSDTSAGGGEVVIEYGSLLSQTITFTGPADTPLANGTVGVSATATSGDAVTFTSTTSTCTVTGTTVTLVSSGPCHIVAHQAGNASYAAADTVERDFFVIPGAPEPAAKTSTGAGPTAQTATLTVPEEGNATLLTMGGSPTPTLTVMVANQGTYALDTGTNIITFTPLAGFTGPATPVRYQVSDMWQQVGDSTYTPTVTLPTGPAPTAKTSTGTGTAAQTATITIPTGGSAALLNGVTPVSTLTVSGQGTYVLSGSTITFTPVSGFADTATPVQFRVTDAYGQAGGNTYTPTVTAPTGPAPTAKTSTGTGTATQTATITIPPGGTVILVDGNNEPLTVQPAPAQGAYTLNGNVITFTPAFGYAGTATPVHFRVTDAYAQAGSNTYTPTVTAPAGPSPAAQTSTGIGTAAQTATITVPTGGSVILVDAANAPLTVQPAPAQGTYSLTGNVITFTPAFGYANTATPVYFRVTDAYGNNGINTYMPTVTAPTGPVAVAQTSTGIGTAAQTVTITTPTGGSVRLLVNGEPTLSWTSPGQGTYVVNAETQVITFTPNFGYFGTAIPATFQVRDAYLQTSNSTYTPTVTPPAAATPSAATSTGVGTATQTATITIPTGGSLTLLTADGASATTVTVVGQGTYVLDSETRVITFTPVFGYAGVATPVRFRVTDIYAQAGINTYTPTVTRPSGPTAAATTSTGVGTAVQSTTIAIPTGGSMTLTDAGTVAGQGTYARGSGSGVITFTPVFGFAGVATPAHFRITDAYGSQSSSTYTPTVTAPGGPAAENLSSTGVGLAQQTVTVAVPTGGSAILVNSGGQPVTAVVASDQGSYTVDSHTGILTFSPADGFLGAATAVTYRAIDAYGQHADAAYRPTVTIPPPPVAPDETSIGRGTTPQSADLVVPAGGSITLLDADGNPVTALLVPGKGTYRLVDVQPGSASSLFTTHLALTAEVAAVDPAAGTATVTFTPVLGYKGEAPPVSYQITDAYGQTDEATYTPTVTLPNAPAPPARTTIGDQNDTQRVTVTIPAGGSVTLLNARGVPVTSITIAGQGTYTLDPSTGVITFVAVDGFTGTPSPVTYRVTDAYGQSASATYSAAVTGGGHGGKLPTTGSPTIVIVLFGVIVVAIGVGLFTAARKSGRRTRRRGRT